MYKHSSIHLYLFSQHFELEFEISFYYAFADAISFNMSFASPIQKLKHALGYCEDAAPIGPTTPFAIFVADGSVMANSNTASADGATVQVNVNDVLASCATDQVVKALPDEALLFSICMERCW